jgi:SAM-dependent methyltransferase
MASLSTPPGGLSYTAYDPFAWFYSRGWGAEYHRQALGALEKLLLSRVPAGARLLDICCGTGDLARTLRGRGYRVTGIDGSGPMLAHARRNAPESSFVRADARQFSFPPVFHAAVSTFDSLNHVLALKELESVFRNVAGALRQGGVWVFDLNMAESFQTVWTSMWAEVEEESVYVARFGYNPASKTGRADITMFRRSQHWERSDTTILERCYAPEEVRGALEAAGFSEIECREARDLGMHGDVALGRSFFSAVRP